MPQDGAVLTVTKEKRSLSSNQRPNRPGQMLSTIPLELLLHIFSYAIFTCSYSITSPQNAALSLSRVCSRWRELVVHTGAFWTRITVDYKAGIPDSADLAKAVLVWLSRAGQMRPLDIAIHAPKRIYFYFSVEKHGNAAMIQDEALEDIDADGGTNEGRYSHESQETVQKFMRCPSPQDSDDPRMIRIAAVLAPSYTRWRSFSCCISDSLLARLFPFDRVGQNAISAHSSSSPFNLPVLEALEIGTYKSSSQPWTGSRDLILHPFTASPLLTSISFPSNSSNLRVGALPWSQLRKLHLTSPDIPLFCFTATSDLTRFLAQCSQLEDLVLDMDGDIEDDVDDLLLPPLIVPRRPLLHLRAMTLLLCGYTHIAPMHLLGSITVPFLETLTISGRSEYDENALDVLGQSDELEDNIPRMHKLFCRSINACLEASNAPLRALHSTVFYADTESIWTLFSAVAETLNTVSFRHGRPAVLNSMQDSPLPHNIHWTTDSDEQLLIDVHVGPTFRMLEDIPEIVFRRVWPSASD